ncbi:hypothetical protein E3983_12200 [Legionella israelensis]|uniref:Dot/Icm T4SS effector n=1 Tax=Legionella israelensis TaxID=454 RepID=A0AAX1EIS3_9GAMM|nr:hypothetical protein [Legionella israelensis]QBR85048.1 hypothetical protein E3983_12200 [Legionella israelensis]
MLIKEIQELVEALAKSNDLENFDKKLVDRLQNQFAHRMGDDKFTKNDLKIVKLIFQDRWQAVIDTPYDYMQNMQGINQIWIGIARLLAKENPSLTVIQLLCPTVKNMRDSNNFSLLANISDFTHLYLGDDDQSVYELSGFIKHLIRAKDQLSTYSSNFKQLRAVTVKELARIHRSHNTKNVLFINKVRYQNAWAYLNKQLFPKLQVKGEIPAHLFPSFLELIKLYFDACSKTVSFNQFKQSFLSWLKHLMQCPIDDVNAFYGVVLNFKQQKKYMLELLIDIHNAKDFTLAEHFLTIGQYLNQFNPAYVLYEEKSLLPVYQKLQTGPYFSLKKFIQLVHKLNANESELIKEKIAELLCIAEEVGEISELLIQKLSEIYSMRWTCIKASEKDYTRMPFGENESWIRLAQYLAGSKKIPANYYRFIMPTLRQDVEPVFSCLITDYPLSHFILSEDETQLILLDVCVCNHKTNGTFRYCREEKLVSLTQIELLRLPFAARQFISYYERCVLKEQIQVPVSLKTLEEVRVLVNGSFYSKGLSYLGEYNAKEYRTSAIAYQRFYEYYSKMNPVEKKALNQQRIVYNGVEKTFKDLLKEVEDNECITSAALYFAQFVMDYAPYFKFSNELEKNIKVDVNTMRKNSAQLIPSDYEVLSQKEAKERCLLIFISLLTVSLPAFMFKNIEFWDLHRKVNDRVKHVFDLILPMVENNDFRDSRFIYARIMEEHIKPLIEENGGLLSRLCSSNPLKLWSLNVKENRPLDFKYSLLELEHILQFLFFLRTHPSYKQLKLDDIIDELIKIGAQEHSSLEKYIRANIAFVNYLNGSSPEIRSEWMDLLADFQYEFVKKDFFSQCLTYIENRLNLIKQDSGKRFLFLWDKKPRLAFVFPPQLSIDICASSNFCEFIMRLKQSLHKEELDLTDKDISHMTDYLRSLDCPILTPSQAREESWENKSDYFSAMLEGNV